MEFNIEVGAANVSISYVVYPTMLDVKSINACTKTDYTLQCYICNLTMKHFRNIDMCLRAPVDESTLQFGISSLHARIRFFQSLYNLGCKMPFKVWLLEKKDLRYHKYKEHMNRRIHFK